MSATATHPTETPFVEEGLHSTGLPGVTTHCPHSLLELLRKPSEKQVLKDLSLLPVEERDVEICAKAIRKNIGNLEHVPKAFLDEATFVHLVDHGASLRHIPEESRSPKVCLAMLRHTSSRGERLNDELTRVPVTSVTPEILFAFIKRYMSITLPDSWLPKARALYDADPSFAIILAEEGPHRHHAFRVRVGLEERRPGDKTEQEKFEAAPDLTRLLASMLRNMH